MNTTERICSIITCLSNKRKPQGASEIARELQINKATMYRLLSELEKAKWVQRDTPTRKYKLGSQAMEVGLNIVSLTDLRNVCLQNLYDLRDITGESTMLSLRVGLSQAYVEQVPGKQELRLLWELGARSPLWYGAPGTAMLAFMDPSDIDSVMNTVFASSRVQFTPTKKVVVADEFIRELEVIRNQGFAVSFGSRIVGSAAIAAPVFALDHEVFGAIAIGGAENRFTVEKIRSYGGLLREECHKISKELGDTE